MEFSRGSVSLQFPFSCHLKVDVQQKLQEQPIEQCMFAYLEQASLEISSIARLNVRLTHIGKFSGNDSGDFPENFSKKNILLYCDVTTDDN